MSKIKYYYDTETCKYEKVKHSPAEIFWNIAGFLLLSTIIGIGGLYLYLTLFQSPGERLLRNENKNLKFTVKLLNNRIDELAEVVDVMKDKDESIYRNIFGVPPRDEEVYNSGLKNLEEYQSLLVKNNYDELLLQTEMKMDKLTKQTALQAQSVNNLLKLSLQKQQMLASIPAIQPMSNPELTKLMSGFGYRIHPIYKVKMFHSGCDFNAPTGTPVYATGDGIVSRTDRNPGGYGNELDVDHGFGYVSKYAHLSKFVVKLNQKVKRGQLIGLSGSSGTATAPHLHYEIIYKGQKVNPVFYFYKDLNPEQYKIILELASRETQPLE